MASYQKVNVFVQDMAEKVHDFAAAGHTIRATLTNSAVTSTFAVLGDLTPLSSGNGYTTGIDVQNDTVRSGGTLTVFGVSIAITASGGPIGPFSAVVLDNSNTTVKTRPLIGYWATTGPITLNDGDSFAIKFSDATTGTTGTIFTIA